MKKLKYPIPNKFIILSKEEFAIKEDFAVECCFGAFFPLNEKIWHQKVFAELKAQFSEKMNVKKTLYLFLFFINRYVYDMRLHMYRKDREMPLVGLVFIYMELEKFFETSIKPTLPSESNKIFEKRLYLEIKRRIFNIFYYFCMAPVRLEFIINQLSEFMQEVEIAYNDKLSLSKKKAGLFWKFDNFKKITPIIINSNEWAIISADIALRFKSLIAEYSMQFQYMYEKKAEMFGFLEYAKHGFTSLVKPDHLERVYKKNRYHFDNVYPFGPDASAGPRRKKGKVVRKMPNGTFVTNSGNNKKTLSNFQVKPKEEKKENMFLKLSSWL